MKINTEELEETIQPVKQTDLIYGKKIVRLLRMLYLPPCSICWLYS